MDSLLSRDGTRLEDNAAYERPNKNYLCGRARIWGTPCNRGPNANGTCGGVTECTPFYRNDRWECKRATREGGNCENGPTPDGECGCTRPPCVPQHSIRALRWRLSVAVAGVVLAFLALFTNISDDNEAFFGALGNAAVDPGPLMGSHSGIFADQNCNSCHEAHGGDSGVWLAGAFKNTDVSTSCTNCHKFLGPKNLPHNSFAKPGKPVRETQCTMCHSEHKGESDIKERSAGQQCMACHADDVSAFDEKHPEFRKTFPHVRRASIRFDHSTHLSKYFSDPKYINQAPEKCTDCHQAKGAVETVTPTSYEKSCASCHESQISKEPLTILRLPEFTELLIELDSVEESCGPFATEKDGDANTDSAAEEEFLSVSDETLNEVAAYLMAVQEDEIEEYSVPVQELLSGMTETGSEYLVEMVESSWPQINGRELFSGLNSEATKRLACAWAGNFEYIPPSDPVSGGWYGDQFVLGYQAIGHGDLVIKAWLDFAAGADDEVMCGNDLESIDVLLEESPDSPTLLNALNKAATKVSFCPDLSSSITDLLESHKNTTVLKEKITELVDHKRSSLERAEAMKDILLSEKEGPGACAKCHAVTRSAKGAKAYIEWTYFENKREFHKLFSHEPHLRLVDPDGTKLSDSSGGCTFCHKLDLDKDFAASFADHDATSFESNFSSIEKQTCLECHGEDRISQTCLTCHKYHKQSVVAHQTTGNN